MPPFFHLNPADTEGVRSAHAARLAVPVLSALGVCGSAAIGVGAWGVVNGARAPGSTPWYSSVVAGGVLLVIGAAILVLWVVVRKLFASVIAGEHRAEQLITRLGIATDSAGIGFWERDLIRDELRWDRTMHRIYLTDEKTFRLTPESWCRMLHPEDLNKAVDLFEATLATHEPYDTTYRIVRDDGTVRNVRSVANVVKDERGRVVSVIGAHWDVTEVTTANRKLANTAARLSLAMHAARLGLWDVTIDPDGEGFGAVRALCDDTLHRMLGYGPGELNTNTTPPEVICHPDEVGSMPLLTGPSRPDDPRGYSWDHRVREKNGDWVWVHDAGKIVERDVMGRPTRLIGVRMDIDEQRRTENALRSVVSMSDGTGEGSTLDELARSIAEAFDVKAVFISRVDEQDTAGELGPVASVVGGWFDGAPVGEKTYSLRGTPCDIASSRSFCLYREGVRRAFPEDGDLVELGVDSYAGVRIESSEGEWLGVLSVMHDRPMTREIDYRSVLKLFAARAAIEIERSAIVAALEQSKEHAERLSDFKGAIVANVSHEMRTPLSAMIGYAELLLDRSNQKRSTVEEFAATIARNGTHLLGLLNDLLDTSKIEAGLLRVERISASPSEIAADVVATLGPRADEKGLALEIIADTLLPSAVRTDPARVRQIVMNLVVNSIKFTDEGAVRIRMSYDADRHELCYSVEDSGIGISESAMEHLFEPFRQAEVSTTRKYGGTGLGLSISRDLARLLGGDITVTSEPGAGSVFRATISAETEWNAQMLSECDIAVRPTLARAAGPVQGPELPRLKGLRVVLAEDSVDNRRLLSFHLRKAGADVVEASDGSEATMLVDEEPPDLLVTDLQMPNLDGYGLIDYVRRGGHAFPIIALTAQATREDETRCRAAGCTGYASKPISCDALIELCCLVTGRPTESEAA